MKSSRKEQKNIQQTNFQNEVFILGAGFSKALNPKYPTLKELSKSIEEQYARLTTDEHKLFDQPTTMIAKYYFLLPKEIRNNIEHVLTYLYADFPWKTHVEQNMDKALYFDILHRISYLFSYQPSNIKPEYKKLGEYINQKNATCITFNYDLLLEKLLNDTFTFRVALTDKNIVSDSYKYHYRMPLTTFDAKDYLKTDSYDYPEILKLHGSINWIYKTNGNINDLMFNPTANNYGIPEGYSPFIVPPVTDKTLFYRNPHLPQIWQIAKERIKWANNIYIIGYSFPETDLSAKFLIEFAMQKNPIEDYNNKKIYLVDLKPNKNINEFCRNKGVNLQEINCSKCEHYRSRAKTLSKICETCTTMPMDNFIQNVIAPKVI